MKAIQFIKDYGVDKAREVVATYHKIPNYTFKEKTERGYSSCKSVEISDLKRLVESVDLINSIGGIKFAKSFIAATWSTMGSTLEQAIADYEAIYHD